MIEEGQEPLCCQGCVYYYGVDFSNPIRPVLCQHGAYISTNVKPPKEDKCKHRKERRHIPSGSRRKHTA